MELKGKKSIIKIILKRKYAITADILLRHKLSYLKEAAMKIPTYTKYFLYFIVLILLDVLITEYVFTLITTTERTPILAALFAFNSVIISVIGILYQVEANNKREIRFKVHRQRKVRYENLIEQIKSDISPVITKMATENTRELNQQINSNQKDGIEKYIDFMFELMLYGSPELIEKRIKQRQIQIENDPNLSRLKTINSNKDMDTDERTRIKERNSIYNLILTYELLLQMRNEIGFEDSSISTRKLLALIWDNIYDSKYDKYFIDMNVPIY